MKIPQPPEVSYVLLLAVVLFGGLWFLTWHSYARDSDDEQWLDPEQPPAMVALPLGLGGRPALARRVHFGHASTSARCLDAHRL